MLRLRKLCSAILDLRTLQALFLKRVLVASEHKHVFTSDLRTIFDVGANKGQFALASRRWSKNARIVSFEPLGEAADVFESLFSDDENVRLHRVALGNEKVKRDMHISKRADSSSILEISQLQDQIFPGTAEAAQRTIDVRKLDEFGQSIEKPAILKIDVQGFELEVLKGGQNCLKCFDSVYCEASFKELYLGQPLVQDVIDWLSQQGFRLEGVYNLHYENGECVQGDFYFQNEESIYETG